MIFAVGDRVRYNLLRPESNLPQWRGTTWRIAALTGDLFARLENDNGDIQDRISTVMLVPVTDDLGEQLFGRARLPRRDGAAAPPPDTKRTHGCPMMLGAGTASRAALRAPARRLRPLTPSPAPSVWLTCRFANVGPPSAGVISTLHEVTFLTGTICDFSNMEDLARTSISIVIERIGEFEVQKPKMIHGPINDRQKIINSFERYALLD